MSTVMYCWRIKKGDFWESMHKVKQDMFKEHPAMVLAVDYREKIMAKQIEPWKAHEEYERTIKEIWQANEVGLAAIQVFDDGRYWLIRPLIYGFNTLDCFKRTEIPVKQVWYDGRVGEGSSHLSKNKAYWMDDKIHRGEYFIHIILGGDEPFKAIVYDIWPDGIDKGVYKCGP